MAHREIRVRPVVRFLVTEFVSDKETTRSDTYGEYDNVKFANKTASALANVVLKSGDCADTVLFFPSPDISIFNDKDHNWHIVTGSGGDGDPEWRFAEPAKDTNT